MTLKFRAQSRGTFTYISNSNATIVGSLKATPLSQPHVPLAGAAHSQTACLLHATMYCQTFLSVHLAVCSFTLLFSRYTCPSMRLLPATMDFDTKESPNT